MNLKDYHTTYGTDEFKALAKKCKSNLIYFYQIASGRRNPSPKLCIVIERESNELVSRFNLRKDAPQIWGEK